MRSDKHALLLEPYVSTGSYLCHGVGGWEKLPESDDFRVALELQPQPGAECV